MPKTSPITKAELARRVGLTTGRISQLVREGLPVLPDGKVDPDRAERWLETALDPQRRQAAKPGKGHAGNVADLRAGKLRHEAALLDLEYRKRRGELVDRAAVADALFKRARQDRDSWLAMPNRIAASIASETGADVAKLYAALDREVRAQLATLADQPMRFSDDA